MTRVAILHQLTERPDALGYQRSVDELNGGLLAALDALGWEGELIATAEQPVDSTIAMARAADLVVLMGGEDVHPAFYGGALEYPEAGHHVAAADVADISVVRDAVARRAPLLAVCRGAQVVNVALGGTLVQHMPEADAHRLVGDEVFREVRVHVDGPLAAAVGAEQFVRCSHHQAIADLASGLRVAARADDGVVEAVEHRDAPLVAVQWHPEHPETALAQVPPLLRHVLSLASSPAG